MSPETENLSERMKILALVEEKKITAEEAARLLEALAPKAPVFYKSSGGEGRQERREIPREIRQEKCCPGPGRVLKILVREKGKEKPTVSITLPLKLAQALKNLVPENQLDKLEAKGIKISALEDLIAEMGDDPIRLVDIDDDDEKVEVYIE